jgi:hypothetical protein
MQKRWFKFLVISLFVVAVILVNRFYQGSNLIQQASADSVAAKPLEIKEPSLL